METVIVDIISWIGLVICIGAFFIKEVFWLRLTTLIGCSLLFIYYAYIEIPQGAVSNLLVLLINAGYLLRTYKKQPDQAVMTDTVVSVTDHPVAQLVIQPEKSAA